MPSRSLSLLSLSLASVAALALISCEPTDDSRGNTGTAGTTGAAGTGSGGGAGTTGTAGTGSNGGAGTTGTAGTGSNGGAGTTGTAGTGAAAGTGGGTDPLPPRALMVEPGSHRLQFSATAADPEAGKSTSNTHAGDTQTLQVDGSKKMQGKLAIVLGGIGGGPGPGGIFGYAVGMGFHGFLAATQTNVSSAPDMYKNMNTDEANRQVGDARMEAWDGKDRVSWLDVKPPDSLVNRTVAALKRGMEMDPGGDWGYYLNADGTVRWTDVLLIGYSFGSQTIAMVSKYVRIGRACVTSGPADEGFPNATWIKAPSATPLDRMYMMVGTADIGNKVTTTTAAGWLGPPTTINGGATGPFTAHQLILQGQGHSEFCAGNGGQWKALCDYCLGVK
jgi:hypothetical protein